MEQLQLQKWEHEVVVVSHGNRKETGFRPALAVDMILKGLPLLAHLTTKTFRE